MKNRVNAFNPCLLILGGGVIEGLPEMIKTMEAAALAQEKIKGKE